MHLRFRVRFAYVALLVGMAFFTYKFVQKTQEVRRLAQQEAAMRAQNQSIAAENARIQRSIKYYRTPQYVEETARAILGYTKPGETPVQSQPLTGTIPRVRVAPPRPVGPPAPAWKQWWKAFFG
ncbi:MAG: hypothetical protein NVSMB52_12370 [Chloroflexota bacterium]